MNDFLQDPMATSRMILRAMRARRIVRRSLDLPIGPVIAYGHPKTATTSAEAAISAVPGIRSFHAHVLQPKHFIWRRNNLAPPMPSGVCSEDNPPQWALADALAGSRPVRLVTLVRDPVAVQSSWFFYGMQRWLQSSRRINVDLIDEDTLYSLFHGIFPRDGILNWFDEEWCPLTGHDLEDLAGVASEGHAKIEFGPHRACVLSSKLEDETKSRILEDFLHLESGSIVFPRKNTAASRPHQETYGRIKAMISADTRLLDRVYGSRYARLLFSPDELDEFRSHWDGLAAEATKIDRSS